jgi:hypothetical protein
MAGNANLRALGDDAAGWNLIVRAPCDYRRQHDLPVTCAMWLEGIVAKRRDRPHRSGRSPDWVKVKNPDAPAATMVIEGWAQNLMLKDFINDPNHWRKVQMKRMTLQSAWLTTRRVKGCLTSRRNSTALRWA